MHLEITATFLDELTHTAEQLGKRKMADMDNDSLSAYKLLLSIIESVQHGTNACGRLIKRHDVQTGKYHTHVLLTSFCIANEWLGDERQ
jgi:hypothetical protein